MSKMKSLILGAFLLVAAANVTAHVGAHDDEGEPITAQEASVIADQALGALVKEKRLDGSWAKLKSQDVKSQGPTTDRVWIVSYNNPAEKDASKRTFYVFIDALGNYLASNHTGKR